MTRKSPPLAVLGFVFFLCCFFSQPAHSAQDVQSQVRELLQDEPELILKVLREHSFELLEILEKAVLDKREHERRLQEQTDLSMPRNPVIAEDRPIRGNPEAPVTIVEYSDFLCPYCSTAADTVKQLMDEHRDTIRLVFKHLPLNPVSREMALAFEAAGMQDQEAAWKLHDMFFAQQNQARAGLERFLADFVREAGLDPARFAADRNSPETAALLENDMNEARQFGFSGTPMFLINGIALRGAVPLHEFERVLDLALSEPQAAQTP